MAVDGDEMEKINIRVPAELLRQIDEEYERRGYTSRSEAIRDALRDWVNPPVMLSEETIADLAESREQAERGETWSLDEVAEKYDVDLDGVDETRRDSSAPENAERSPDDDEASSLE